MAKFRPLLGYRKNPVIEALRWPMLGSPKYDGIRGLVDALTQLLSRKLKRIPNRHARELFEDTRLIGREGEMIAGPPTAPDVMQRTTSAVMSIGEEDLELRLYVFDYFLEPSWEYRERYGHLLKTPPPHKGVVIVKQELLRSPAEAYAMEERVVKLGFEGLMLRDPSAPYKMGRSTLDEQYLLKWKRFKDSEATIIRVEEGDRNENELERDERGYAKRSKKAEGMVPNGTFGRFICHDRKEFPDLEEFRIGSGPGLTLELRAKLWKQRASLIGQKVKYRFQEVGVKDAPRFPRYVAIRDWRDM